MFAIHRILFTSATLYAPALALSTFTGLSVSTSVISVGLVGTFYSTIGGMRAVLWTDVFQSILMFICLFAVIGQGLLLLGGIGNVFEIANNGGRLVIPKFSFNLNEQYSMVNIFFQGMIIMMSNFGGDQTQVQRLMTLRNVKRSRIATYIGTAMIAGFQLLSCFSGLILYAYYQYCDPMTSPSKPIHSADQIVPYFISTTLSHLPGIRGLCICGIFSASLSTASSAINSLASIATEDFIKPLFPRFKVKVFHLKLMTLFFGTTCIALSFIISSLGHLIKISVILVGNLCGPNLAVFLLAACTTTANEGGVILGFATGIVLASCLSFIPERKTYPFLPLSYECSSFESTEYNTNYTSSFSDLQNHTSYINSNASSAFINGLKTDEGSTFHISYMWVSCISMLTCLIVGYFGSMAISFFSEKSQDVKEMHLSKIRFRFFGKTLNNKDEKRHDEKEEAEIQIALTSGDSKNQEDHKIHLMKEHFDEKEDQRR